MPRRIEVELTSKRPDGTWTWRAAGAKLPKGELDADIVFDGAVVGDVVRAEADFHLDGIEILAVLPPAEQRDARHDVIEVRGTGNEGPPVTTQLAPRRARRDEGGARRGGGGGRDGRRPREHDGGRKREPARTDAPNRAGKDGPDRKDEKPGRDAKGGRKRPERSERTDRPARRRPEPQEHDDRPRPKRLRPGRVHRSAWLDSLPAEKRVVAEQVLMGGVPAVRKAIDKQNEQARTDGHPEVRAEPLVTMAENLLAPARAAEWRDRADAAVADLDELDLRDLRAVVSAAELAARDDESRALAESLRTALLRRTTEEHEKWLAELTAALNDDRLVRALRLSSHPPKAGAPLPPELHERLLRAATAGLTAEISPQRWATVLDALAYSPVHLAVTPEGYPPKPGDELLATARRHATRVPHIAAALGVQTARPTRTGRARPVPPPPPPPEPETAAVAAPAEGQEPEAPAAPDITS